MSSKSASLLKRIERGERVKLIRESLEMTGEEFALELTKRAKAHGYDVAYDRTKVSRMEGSAGGRDLSVEELAIILELDPEHRSLAWLVFGDNRKLGSVRPRPLTRRTGTTSG